MIFVVASVSVSSTHFLRSDVVVQLFLELLSYPFRRDGVEVGGGEDLVDEGAVGSMLLWRDWGRSDKRYE